MGLIFNSFALDVTFAVASFLVFMSWFYTTAFAYWSSRGVHSIKPVVFFGNTKDKILMVRSFTDVQMDIYRKTEGHRFVGFYDATTPILMIRDPELIKNVLVRDFQHFTDRGYPENKHDPISVHLFALGGSKWRKLRTKLTPTFTSGKIKMMYKLMLECSEELLASLEGADKGEGVVDVKDIASKYTTDVIGSCAFGLQMNALKDPHSEFRAMGRRMLQPTELSLKLQTVVTLFPVLGKILAKRRPELSSFFLNTVRDIVSYREKNNVVRDDFIQLLIQLKKYGKVEDEKNSKTTATQTNLQQRVDMKRDDSLEITDSLLAAQCYIFFIAGFETSSTTISCCLHELSVNTAIQDRARREVNSVLRKHAYDLTYEAIQEMKYLDQVVDETLRKYPPSGYLMRVCTKPYTIPSTNVHINKGTMVNIPVRCIHHDPKYFPYPERFDPDRFSEENVKKIPQFTYMPFGEGPRLCIGMRFGRMQVKVCLVALLRGYEFSVCESTSVPLKFSFNIPLADTPKEVWLRIKKILAIRELSPKDDIYTRVKVQREVFQNLSRQIPSIMVNSMKIK